MKRVFTVVIIVILGFSIFSFQFSKKVFADTSCQSIYGGGQTCTTSSDILLDKKILNPQTNKLVDNLGINDPKYKPDFIVNFQIKITNTGSDTLSKVDVKDIFPQYVTFSAGPGNFDSNTKTLSFNAGDIKPNESKAFTIVGRVVNKDSLPQETICVVNQAIATANNNQTSQDNAQLCIENVSTEIVKGGFPIISSAPIKQTPATGPEALALFAMIPTGLVGLALRKYSIKKEARN